MYLKNVPVDRVYRVFADQNELYVLLNKGWQGKGLHALYGCPPDSKMSLKMKLKDSILGINIQSISESSSQRLKSLAPGKKPKSTDFTSKQKHIQFATSLKMNELKIKMDVDNASLITNDLEIKLQALENIKLHCSLYLGTNYIQEIFGEKQSVKLLAFSGVLNRV